MTFADRARARAQIRYQQAFPLRHDPVVANLVADVAEEIAAMAVEQDPPEAEVRAAVAALADHVGWYSVPDEGAECTCGEKLTDGVETYAVPAWERHRARAALLAAAKVRQP